MIGVHGPGKWCDTSRGLRMEGLVQRAALGTAHVGRGPTAGEGETRPPRSSSSSQLVVLCRGDGWCRMLCAEWRPNDGRGSCAPSRRGREHTGSLPRPAARRGVATEPMGAHAGCRACPVSGRKPHRPRAMVMRASSLESTALRSRARVIVFAGTSTETWNGDVRLHVRAACMKEGLPRGRGRGPSSLLTV